MHECPYNKNHLCPVNPDRTSTCYTCSIRIEWERDIKKKGGFNMDRNIPIQIYLRNWAKQGIAKAFEDSGMDSTPELLELIADTIDKQHEGAISIPVDDNGKPWKINDACITEHGEYGKVKGYDGLGNICVEFEGDTPNDDRFVWYDASELARDYVQHVIDEIELFIEESPNNYSSDELKHWIDLLKKSKEE